MKRFRSHKEVDAAEIIDILSSLTGFEIVAETYDESNPTKTYPVDENFFKRGKAKPGDFLVLYNDNYLSWSPRKPFIEGYTEIERSKQF